MPKNIIVISVGGSLIAPEQVDVAFLKSFRCLILGHIRAGKRFIIICGGGRTSRIYQNAARKLGVTKDDADWLGICATKINAQLLAALFRKWAHPKITDNPSEHIAFREKILVASGWKPGFSSDYDAVLLARNFGAKKLVNLTNIDYVCDKDPNKFRDAEPIKEMTWKRLLEVIPRKWSPGMHAPFDPVAAKAAQQLRLEVAVINGRNLKSLGNYLQDRSFKGTIIRDRKPKF
ncbi:MAG: UMP kinase [Candidatus Micrarchaeota archaeon]